MMISKELLSEVLKEEVAGVYSENHLNCIWWGKTLENIDIKINIYELAHKCKEWAYSSIIDNRNSVSNVGVLSNMNLLSRKFEELYQVKIDNGKDLNCSLAYYAVKGRDNYPLDEAFNLPANTLNEMAFYGDSEPEAIFKATQWVLDNKEK